MVMYQTSSLYRITVIPSYLGVFGQYSDVTMGAMASQITSLTIVYSTIYSGPDQRKHQSSASMTYGRGIHRWPVNSTHKGPITRKMFPFDAVIMITLDHSLKFDVLLSDMCKKVSRQINVLKEYKSSSPKTVAYQYTDIQMSQLTSVIVRFLWFSVARKYV